MPKKDQKNTMKLFSSNEPNVITAGQIRRRLEDMERIAGFSAETEEQKKAAYALYKNIERYKQACRALDAMKKKQPEAYKEYTKKSTELALACGGVEKSLPNGQRGVGDIEDMNAFRAGVVKLRKEYAKVIEQADQVRDYNVELDDFEVEDVPVPFMTSYDYFPDSVSARDRSRISFMIEDTTKPNSNSKDEK